MKGFWVELPDKLAAFFSAGARKGKQPRFINPAFPPPPHSLYLYCLGRKLIERIENGLELEPAANKYVTGACARILLDGEMDQIAALNTFEEICQTEIESRDIYQVYRYSSPHFVHTLHQIVGGF